MPASWVSASRISSTPPKPNGPKVTSTNHPSTAIGTVRIAVIIVAGTICGFIASHAPMIEPITSLAAPVTGSTALAPDIAGDDIAGADIEDIGGTAAPGACGIPA